MTSHIGIGVKVQCERCGKVGDDREIPTLQYPDGSFKTLCEKCLEGKEPPK